ncbi:MULTISPECIES: TetR/AcrR family transcriptional regulator [unclassified Rathayibacter]|uniref:TetR/AcrR family transcriptional regulator n=1 Tax=unclassified Rathayibacter TaxID=2609250 RepID=UPI00188D01C9|nr:MULTISPECIES: TetR/AcrR family transcriptional regulator [unclassified Rathayibacter]MBF4461571.1 TetR family transcriptional regulator [Rathayibacter sp. VKM Ac-2879]MBF4502982.1 TetR family transcriptional regulator [Rathayibacter sp. VKM Ac-2878]
MNDERFVPDESAPSERPSRLPREEVRSRLLDAALSVVRAEGLRVGVGHLALEDVIRSAGVSRSTVYRIWPTRQDFYDELIAAIPERVLTSRLDQSSLTEGDSYLHRHIAPTASPEQRRQIVAASVSMAIEANFENVFSSQTWRNFLALSGAVDSHEEPARSAIHEALRARQTHFIENMAKYYRHTFAEAGLRLRPGYDYAAFASAVAAFVEGLCIARVAAPELVTGPVDASRPESPSLVVAGVLMLLDGFSEPVPTGDDAAHRASD